MLYDFDACFKPEITCWTEIYVIITVSSMVIEEVRRVKDEFSFCKGFLSLCFLYYLKLYHEYEARTTERWGSTESRILTVASNLFFILPYLLFYLGLAFRYAGNTEELHSVARSVKVVEKQMIDKYLL